MADKSTENGIELNLGFNGTKPPKEAPAKSESGHQTITAANKPVSPPPPPKKAK